MNDEYKNIANRVNQSKNDILTIFQASRFRPSLQTIISV